MAAVAFWRAGLMVRAVWGKLIYRLHFKPGVVSGPEVNPGYSKTIK
jgi:hypothetical protein